MSGNSAYVFAEITDEKYQLIELFKEPRHKDHVACETFLCEAIERLMPDVIAIDAPLTLPLALIKPNTAQLSREGSGEILNPYLFRYTDYYIYKTFGLRPMPPAGDRIGRLTARAIALLQRYHYSFPYLHVKEKMIPIYEVYPKQIAQFLDFKAYKKDPQELFDTLHVRREDYDEHLLDTLLCAFAGYHITQGNTIQAPLHVSEEGWCFPLIGADTQ